MHPLYKLLTPHFLFTARINADARGVLVSLPLSWPPSLLLVLFWSRSPAQVLCIHVEQGFASRRRCYLSRSICCNAIPCFR